MNVQQIQHTPDRRRRWFRLVAVAVTLLMALVAAESALRIRDSRIQGSDRMDLGLIRPDPFLGWRLTPGWSGTHEHHDFSVQYRIAANGFRASSSAPGRSGALLHAIVGDSFTFGLGVEDDQTFVELLTRQAPELGTFLNFAVPGYSTDQEALLIEDVVLVERRPAVVWLVVYLANDFLDNQRPVPLQVRLPKPFFVWRDGRLELRNSPVDPGLVQDPLPAFNSRQALAEAVFGPGRGPSGPGAWIERHSSLAALATGWLASSPDYRGEFANRLAPAIELFDRIIERVAERCRAANVELRLVILPGRSFVEQPGSFSAQYQECFRAATVRIAGERGLPVVDVAAAMLSRRGSERARWFHPNDGHLTRRGHEVVAEMLTAALQRRRSEVPAPKMP
jgi:lysophospholipase L1-like esterase